MVKQEPQVGDASGDLHGSVSARIWPRFTAFAIAADGHASAAASSPFAQAELLSLGPEAGPSRQRSFLVGRQAAHQALATLGCDLGPVLIGANREPIWPEGVVGSISHTDDQGVALVARHSKYLAVGLDLERRSRSRSELGAIAELATNVQERAWLDSFAPTRRDDLVLALFSAKESVFKALFPTVGSLFGFDAITLRPVDGGFEAELVQDLHPAFATGHTAHIRCQWFDRYVLTWVLVPQ